MWNRSGRWRSGAAESVGWYRWWFRLPNDSLDLGLEKEEESNEATGSLCFKRHTHTRSFRSMMNSNIQINRSLHFLNPNQIAKETSVECSCQGESERRKDRKKEERREGTASKLICLME
ncbi:hypothetical protein AND_009302 [Anopheles darlingi]|uniref:Uncharacterized protein n=1 Tax=Anopheles darlingi TaxID=43151 RepID=W5J8M8_ANODA|nr:hypothetical protein AND_009302 [Anopheles darlingi]